MSLPPRPATASPSADAKAEVIQPADYQFLDRRSEPRQDCDDRGALLYMSEKQVITCRIMDQSPSGARVAFDNVGSIPSEIWLIDLDTHMARRGSAAWSTPTRMGLKFNFVQTLVPGQPCPQRVPQEVFDVWMKLTGQIKDPPSDEGDGDDVLYLD
jgi:hypothetical protein